MSVFDWILGKLRAKKGEPRFVSQERVRFDFAQGEQTGSSSLVDIARKTRQLMEDPLSDPEFIAGALGRERQREQLDELQGKVLDGLIPISEAIASQFFGSVGIDNPVRVRNVGAVFSNMRTRARLGAEYGDVYYISIGASEHVANEFIYVHQGEKGRTGDGLLVCKLPDGTFFTYATSGEMKAKLKLFGGSGSPVGTAVPRDQKRYGIRIIPIPGGPADGESERLWSEGTGPWTTTSVQEAQEKCRYCVKNWGSECEYELVVM